jgi:alcohol dehydrogenase (NADP+)
VVLAIARQNSVTPAQVLLSWAIQRGTAILTTSKTPERIRENYNISEIPQDAVEEINRIQIRRRLNSVVETGVPGFIAQGG